MEERTVHSLWSGARGAMCHCARQDGRQALEQGARRSSASRVASDAARDRLKKNHVGSPSG